MEQDDPSAGASRTGVATWVVEAVVDLGPAPVDVALHWQRWRLDTPALDRLSGAVRRAAHAGMRPVPAPVTPGGT